MAVRVTTRVINIGNSRGIRIPKLLLEQLGPVDEVELRVEDDQLIVRPRRHVRYDWEERFRLMAERSDDRLLDPEAIGATRWDVEEWEWS